MLRTSGARRRLVQPRPAVLAALLFLALWSVPSAASAHAVLTGTTPAAGTVPTAPDAVTVTFDEPPRTQFSVVHVLAPGGRRVDGGKLTLQGSTVRQPLIGPRPAGVYTVDWRVVSDDGHPVSGSWQFTATAAAGPVSGADAAPVAAPAPASKGTGHGAHLWFAVVAAALLVASWVGERWWRHRSAGPR